MTKWRKNKTFIKSPRKKLEIKKIRTDNKIPKTKKINMCFVGEESENKGETVIGDKPPIICRHTQH